ncbi:MAG: class II fumarate hydratase [Chloroflexi bacterium]|nr:class II fumarate hydratase [Chloroflexota bacterium]
MAGGPVRRTERDTMGELEVPDGAYYGASTMRAVKNFPASGLKPPSRFVSALALIKLAAAKVNADLGLLDRGLADAIVTAATEIVDGKLDGQIVVDVLFQTGSGTSTNMNANEVIANRAIELLGGQIGSRKPVHPNDHVNICQSSNDVIPSAIQLAALVAIKEDLIPALERLQAALLKQSDELMPVIKTGRTHLQDATPVRLGQEFLGYAGQAERAIRRLKHAQEELGDLPLGGTAVGTGINAHPEFSARACKVLSELSGVEVWETTNHFQAQNTLDAVLETSGVLRTTAISLIKIANDIRWMASGPRAGFAELDLPALQPGSSIMPGKVNPVIAEAVCQVVGQVVGNDQTVAISALQGSNFELNVMMPVACYNVLQSIELLAHAADNFATNCIEGLTATTNGPSMVERGLMICTALAPEVGYDAAASIAKEAYASGRTIREVARDKTSLSESDLDRLLDPSGMTEPGLTGGPGGG